MFIFKSAITVKSLMTATAITLVLASGSAAFATDTTGSTSLSTTTSIDSNANTRIIGNTDTSVQSKDMSRATNQKVSTRYGNDTSASARGGDIITNTPTEKSENITDRKSGADRVALETDKGVDTIHGSKQVRAEGGVSAETGATVPSRSQMENGTAERLSNIETAVGTTSTTVDQISPRKKVETYEDMDDTNLRIDQDLKSTVKGAYPQNRETTNR